MPEAEIGRERQHPDELGDRDRHRVASGAAMTGVYVADRAEPGGQVIGEPPVTPRTSEVM